MAQTVIPEPLMPANAIFRNLEIQELATLHYVEHVPIVTGILAEVLDLPLD